MKILSDTRAAGDPPELLALRALKLGDLLVAVPALHAIRRARPEHRLVLAMPAWLDEIVDVVDGVDALLPTPGLDDPLPLPAGRIDTVVNLHGNGPESRGILDALQAPHRIGHRWPASTATDAGLTASGASVPPAPAAPRSPTWQGPDWVDGIHERVRWARLVEGHGMPADPNEVWLNDPGPSARPGAVVVHVGAFYGCRRWPVERFASVVRALAADGADVVLTGSTAERERALAVAELARLGDDHVLAGRIGLRAFAAVVAHAELVVSADTGAAHLASAFATPSVVIFGPAPVEEWGPPPGPHIALTDARLRRGDTFGDEPDPALLAVSVADVLAAADTVRQRAA
ncbi:glycosyltransferase family 9 protein [Microbacterium sp. STN6]|uniref:glycosyltransferase family 9 protein n=1 Tax=Microbacterium sp. STN6 TaxID=2995588 RepID=UPI003A598B67